MNHGKLVILHISVSIQVSGITCKLYQNFTNTGNLSLTDTDTYINILTDSDTDSALKTYSHYF